MAKSPKSDPGFKVCSFCGKSADVARRLIAGPGVFICDECVHVCKKILDDEEEHLSVEFTEDIPKPREIKAYLDGYVIAQEQAKRTLSVAVYRGAAAEPFAQIRMATELTGVRKFLARLDATVPVRAVYEAGGCGYWLARAGWAAGDRREMAGQLRLPHPHHMALALLGGRQR